MATSHLTTRLDGANIQSKLSKTWKVVGKHQVTYTGGPMLFSKDGTHMICIHGEDPTSIVFYRVSTGQIVHELDCGEDDPICAFTISPNQQTLFTCHIRSSLVKVWDIESKHLSFQFKSEHNNDITCIECDSTGTLIATCSMDQQVKIRYTNNGHLTHQLPSHGSPITCIAWNEHVDKLLLAVGTQNGIIRVHWLGDETSSNKHLDLLRADYDGTVNKSHVSKVTSIAWSQCGTKLISVGYDKMWRVWDFLTQHNTKQSQLAAPTQASSPPTPLSQHKGSSLELTQHFYPGLQLQCTEIANYLVLDDLESVRMIPYQTPVPVRKKDSTEYVTKTLEEDNQCVYFATSGVKGVTTIWKITYDYILKRKAIAMVFKHSSIQSYTSQNIPYNSLEYQSKLYAVTPQGAAQKKSSNDENDVFDTPLHLQWSKMFLILPASLLTLQQRQTTTPITLRDGTTIRSGSDQQIAKTIKLKDVTVPSLPLLTADREYEEKLIAEQKYYDSQEMLNKENKIRNELKQKRQFENTAKLLKDDKDEPLEDIGDVFEDIGEVDEVMNEATEDEKEQQKRLELTRKLREFRGVPVNYPQMFFLNGDHNLYCMDLSTFDIKKVHSLYSLSINDVKIIPNTRCVVVVTNSNQLRIFNIDSLHCTVLFPMNDIICACAVSSCGRFLLSSTIKGEIYAWVLYHYDEQGFIPLKLQPDDTGLQTQSKSKKPTKIDSTCPDSTPTPIYESNRLGAFISAHIVAELQGHLEAPSALAFSHSATPSFEQRLISTNESGSNQANRILNPNQSLSRFLNCPTVYNYNRLSLFACTGGADKTVKTWNLSSLYIYVDPALYPIWSSSLTHYKSVLLTPSTTSPTTKSSVEMMQQPEKHVFVLLADKSVVNASYVLYNHLLTSSTPSPITTVSQDHTQSYQPPPPRIIFQAVTTTLAHEKEINSIVIHPNNTLIATCSEDKTAKVWKYSNSATLTTGLQLVGNLKGHRRTVWNVMFCPHDKFIITVSSDKLIKVWSIVDFSCVQTIQGHTAPVVTINWLRFGMQFMTADSNGIMRLWNLHDNTGTGSGSGECISVCDEPHEARINGLDINHHYHDSFMVTADSNALLVIWNDTTLYDELLAQQKQQSEQLTTQLLENALERKEFATAFELALKLQHVRRLFTILNDVIDQEQRYKRWKALKTMRNAEKEKLRAKKIQQELAKGNKLYDPECDPEIIGQEELYINLEARENLELRIPKPKTTVAKLISKRTLGELDQLFNVILDWNTNSKFSHVAQYVLNVIQTTLSPEILSKIRGLTAERLQIFIAYSQRHYTRTSNLLQSSYLVDNVLSNMNIFMPLHQQDRAEKIQQAQGQDVSQISVADWLANIGNNDSDGQKSEADLLQHVLSLHVDDSLLQYEIISDDEDDLVTAAGSVSYTKGKGKIGEKKQVINYYYGSNQSQSQLAARDNEMTVDSDGSDYWNDSEDELDEKTGTIKVFDPIHHDELVQLTSVKVDTDTSTLTSVTTKRSKSKENKGQEDPLAQSFGSWGDFGDDWEAMGQDIASKNNTLMKDFEATKQAQTDAPEQMIKKSKKGSKQTDKSPSSADKLSSKAGIKAESSKQPLNIKKESEPTGIKRKALSKSK